MRQKNAVRCWRRATRGVSTHRFRQHELKRVHPLWCICMILLPHHTHWVDLCPACDDTSHAVMCGRNAGRTADAQRVRAVLAGEVLLEHRPVAGLAHVLRDGVAEEHQLKALRTQACSTLHSGARAAPQPSVKPGPSVLCLCCSAAPARPPHVQTASKPEIGILQG